MNPRPEERWAEIERLLDQVLDTDPKERPQLLARICSDQPEVAYEVERLLDAIAADEQFLQDSAPAYAVPLISQMLDVTELVPGTQLGPYEITGELGRGGTATVYLAQDHKHGRRVAVKVPHAELAFLLGPNRFLREIQIAAQLQHPSILPLHDSGEDNGVLYYVMPYVEGESLRQRLVREGELSIEDAVHIARQVADALAYAHAHGIVHRDIKPDNSLLSGEHAQVADFGIARAITMAGGERLHETGPLGTAAYMSPEQAAADPQLDGRTDIYSLGCVLYEMLAGEPPPYTGSSAPAITTRRLSEPLISISKLRSGVPVSVEVAVHRALARSPADRFTTARDFAQALQPPAAMPARARRARTIPIGIAAGMALLAATGAVLLRGDDESLTLGRIRQLTNAPGLELDPELSPDGKLLAYAAGPLLMTHIYVRPTEGGRPVEVTHAVAGGHRWPHWSPDGTRILFVSILADTQFVDVIPALGGPVRHLVARAGEIMSAVWSPDGKSIAYAPPRAVVVQRLDGGTPDTLARVEEPNSLSWSPDGSRIAYVESNGAFTVGTAFGNMAPSAIEVVPVIGGSPVPVTSREFQNSNPVWSRDSRSLLFLSTREGQRDLYRVRLAKSGTPVGRPERITTGLRAHSAAMGPDGGTLLYTALSLQANVWSIRIPQRGSISIREAEPVTEGNQSIEIPDVSPDGKWIAFDSDQSGNADIYRMPLPRGEVERLTDDPADDFAPGWSPDGREIAFHSFRSGSRDLFVIPSGGGPARQVTRGSGQDRFAHWSPDGRRIAFERDSTPNLLYLVEHETSGRWGKPRRVGVLGVNFAGDWSADGRHIYVAVQGSLREISIPDGRVRVVYRPGNGAQPRPLAVKLTDHDRTIVFKTENINGSFWSIPVAGGTPRQLVRFDVPGRDSFRADFDISGDRIYFVMANHQSDVFMAELR